MIFNYFTIFFPSNGCINLFYNNNLIFNYPKLKKIKKFKKIYAKFLYQLLYKLKFKLKIFNKMKLNWRFRFLSFYNILSRIKYYNFENINEFIEIFYNNLIYFSKFINFYKKKIFVQLKRKLNLFKNKFLKKTIKKLFNFKSVIQSSLNNLKYYSFTNINPKFIEFNIHIKIKKNNIFIIFKNLYIKKLIFFISAGRIFKGKKKRNYLTGRFLSKTLLRLIVRFLLKFKHQLHLPYFFTIKHDKILKYFLIKSIFNSLKYFDFPILSVQNIYSIPHSKGLKLKKMRRL